MKKRRRGTNSQGRRRSFSSSFFFPHQFSRLPPSLLYLWPLEQISSSFWRRLPLSSLSLPLPLPEEEEASTQEGGEGSAGSSAPHVPANPEGGKKKKRSGRRRRRRSVRVGRRREEKRGEKDSRDYYSSGDLFCKPPLLGWAELGSPPLSPYIARAYYMLLHYIVLASSSSVELLW